MHTSANEVRRQLKLRFDQRQRSLAAVFAMYQALGDLAPKEFDHQVGVVRQMHDMIMSAVPATGTNHAADLVQEQDQAFDLLETDFRHYMGALVQLHRHYAEVMERLERLNEPGDDAG